MRTPPPALFLLALGVGCADSSPPGPPGTPEAWKEELMATDRAFSDATAERGAEGWVSFFGRQGSMISQGIGETRGAEAILRLMQPVFADSGYSLTWEPIRAEVSSAGDLGYTVGRYTSVHRGEEGGEVRTTGLYVSVWRRQEDGSWKVEMDLGNPLTS